MVSHDPHRIYRFSDCQWHGDGMTWIKLDDTFPDHPKVLDAGDEASWLFVCALCYCSRHLSDGFIPEGAVGRLTGLSRLQRHVTRLLDVGLWVRADGGYRVHGYSEWQRTRESIEAEREAGKERAKRSRERTANVRRSHATRGRGEEDSPQTPRQGGGLRYCASCGLPYDAAPGVPHCICASNVIDLRPDVLAGGGA